MKVTNAIVNIANDSNNVGFLFWNDYYINRKKYKFHAKYATELMNLTITTTNASFDQNINFITTNNINEGLQFYKKLNFEVVIVQTPGHILKGNFLTELLNYTNTLDWSLIGHILDKGNWLTLHDQCFVINLTKFFDNELDFNIEKQNLLVPLYDRSFDNFHDNYTPKFVKFNNNFSKMQVGFAANILSKSLLTNSLHIFPESIRNTKTHLYPENDMHYEDWNGIGLTDVKGNQLSQLTKIIENHANPKSRQIHFFNNESCNIDRIKKFTKKEKFENLIVPASGFYANQFLKHFDVKKIIFFDIMPDILNIKKELDKIWDGSQEKLDEISYKHKDIIFDSSKEKKLKDMYVNDLYSFTKYKEVIKEYVEIDIIQLPERFVDIVPKNGDTFIWLNSIYTYWYNLWLHKPHNIVESYIILMKSLAKNKNKIWIEVKDPLGGYKLFEKNDFFLDYAYKSGYSLWT